MATISQAELDATWQQLDRVPRPDLARALARVQDLGARAFKRKDFRAAYDHYNQAVTGLEYLARAGPAGAELDAVKALANRSACKLGLEDAKGAAQDAAECASRAPRWPKGWYRLGRALVAKGQFTDAAQTFAEGRRLDPENAEFEAWGARCRRHADAATAAQRRARRHETDYARFDFVDDDGEAAPPQRNTRAPVVETVEEMHDLMQRKQQAQIDRQTPADIYYVQTMLGLPQATNPAALAGQTALAAVVSYLERASALAAPFRRVNAAAHRASEAWRGATNRVRSRLGAAGVEGAWLHVGAGCGRSLARCARAATSVRCLSCGPSAGARAVLAANDLTHVAFEEAPVEEVFGTDAPALVVVLDPDLFDEGLLGRRLLPYVRHCRHHLAVPECVVIPARARVYCAPLAARLPDSHGIPLGALDAYRWGPWYEELDLDGSMQALQGTYTLLAPPRPCFALDFGADDVEEALRAREVGLEFAASAGGVLNGVAFWYELEMVDELRHATGPGSGGKQAVQWVDPVTVKKGSHIKITAQLMETRLTFAITSPCRVAPVVRRHCLGRWHLEMVADSRRNDAFRDGIRHAVAAQLARPGPRPQHGGAMCAVLDFGTGSGLLALYAAQAGASSVLGVDTSAHVLECARRIAARTPYAPTFIHKDCRRLEAGRDFDEKADVLVMELFDYGLLGEGCLHFARHAWTHCLREDARVVPRGATLRAMLVQLGSNDEDLDVSCLTTQRFQSDYYGLQLREEPHKRLSEPFDVFGFDFGRTAALGATYLEGAWRGDVTVVVGGRLNCVVFWHALDLGEATLATGPDEAETCWLQACQPLEEIWVEAGTPVPLKASHQGSRCTFSVERSEDYADRRTATDLYDPRALALHNELAVQSAKLEKTVVFDSEARQEAADAALGVAVDPARLGWGGRYVDGSCALQFAWTFFQGDVCLFVKKPFCSTKLCRTASSPARFYRAVAYRQAPFITGKNVGRKSIRAPDGNWDNFLQSPIYPSQALPISQTPSNLEQRRRRHLGK